jgi:hypothetical protein
MVLKETKVNEEFRHSMDQYRNLEKGKGLLQQCSTSPVLFAEHMLGIRLYSWQIDFLTRINKAVRNEYWTREFVALTSRQIGKSLSIAVFSLWACVFNKCPGTVHNNTVVGIISASDVQSKKLLYEIKKLMRLGDKYMMEQYKEESKSLFGEKFFTKLLDSKNPNNMTTVSFIGQKVEHGEYLLKGSKSGNLIKSYPPTAVVLGETFTVVIEDEAGKNDRLTDQFHYDYVYPTGNSTNAIRIYTSTPWVSSGFFYRLTDPNDEFGSNPADRIMYTVDAIQIENPEYYHDVYKTILQMQKDGKLDEVSRAYYCRFVKGEQSFFDPDKVSSTFTNEYQMVDLFTSECDMGIDFGGQVKSRTVITISAQNSQGVTQRLFCKTYEVGKDLGLIQDVEDLLKRFNVQRIIPDECPAGDFLIRLMREKGWNVHPMNFRADKVKKYGAFRSALNKNLLQSYNDDALKTEMLALEYSHKSKQSLIQHAPGYSDDLIDSWLMSVYFLVQEENDFKWFNIDDNGDEDKWTIKRR